MLGLAAAALVAASGSVAAASGEAAWPVDTLDWRAVAVDLSFLNAPERPAGKRGFLKAVGNQFVFEDGTTPRFWGTNLSGPALFRTSKDNIRAQAQRLSRLGFNLVRLHHHDSAWVDPNVFGPRDSTAKASVDAKALDGIDWWIKCLKDEGIYIWLDLHVGRHLSRSDGIVDFDELSRGKPTVDLKGYNYVNPSIREAMQRLNQEYVTHLNPHTGLRYRDDPGIAAMLITNENDITQHFGNRLLPDKGVPEHTRRFMAEAFAFADRHHLPRSAVARSWEPGPGKLFLNDLEYQFHHEMIGHLRAHGVKVPIATTSTWGMNPLTSLPALTAGDLIDVHSYGGADELQRNPLLRPNLMHWMAAAQVAGKPISVSEWNVEPFPVADRHAVALYLAAGAAFQGWSAVLQYAYAQDAPNSATKPSNWHAFNDPALIATLPAAALAYRRGDVQRARTTYVFVAGRERFFGERLSPASSVALRTAPEKGRLVIALPEAAELPWLKAAQLPADAQVIVDPHSPLLSRDAVEAVSDTGELRRNWERGIFTLDTRRTQAASGLIGGKTITLSSVEIAVQTQSATVAVQSLDERPISESTAILVSLGARAVPATADALPFHSEPVTGRISVRARKGMKLYKKVRGADQQLPAPYEAGQYRISLDRGIGAHWLTLR